MLGLRLSPVAEYEELCIVFADVAGYSTFVAETGDGLMIAVDTPTDALRIATSLVHGFDDQMRARRWPVRLRAGAHRGTCRRLATNTSATTSTSTPVLPRRPRAATR